MFFVNLNLGLMAFESGAFFLHVRMTRALMLLDHVTVNNLYIFY